MKNFSRIITVLGLIVLPLAAFSTANFGISEAGVQLRVDEEHKIVHLALEPSGNDRMLTVQDERGVIYQTIDIEAGEIYEASLDMTSLEIGAYMLILREGAGEWIQPFLVRAGALSLRKDDAYHINRPQVMKRDGGAIDLYYACPRLETLRVTIEDDKGNVLYKDIYANQVVFQKRYRLERVEGKSLLFTIKTPQRTYTEVVRL